MIYNTGYQTPTPYQTTRQPGQYFTPQQLQAQQQQRQEQQQQSGVSPEMAFKAYEMFAGPRGGGSLGGPTAPGSGTGIGSLGPWNGGVGGGGPTAPGSSTGVGSLGEWYGGAGGLGNAPMSGVSGGGLLGGPTAPGSATGMGSLGPTQAGPVNYGFGSGFHMSPATGAGLGAAIVAQMYMADATRKSGRNEGGLLQGKIGNDPWMGYMGDQLGLGLTPGEEFDKDPGFATGTRAAWQWADPVSTMAGLGAEKYLGSDAGWLVNPVGKILDWL